MLNLSEAELAGVLRPRAGRLDSPSNRYAGDWSRCGESYLSRPPRGTEEADYDDVPSEAGVEEEEGEEEEEEEEEEEQQQEKEKEHKVYEVEVEKEVKEKPEARQHDWEDGSEKESEKGKEEEEKEEEEKRQETDKEGAEEEDDEEEQGEVLVESDSSGCTQPLETKMEEEVATMEREEEEKGQQQEEEEEKEEEEEEERLCKHILQPHLPKKHAYHAYVKIQDISPALGDRVNLQDLQESIDTLIGNLERELNKNKLNAGY